VLNNKVRLSSVAVKNDFAIRSSDGEGEFDGSSLLTEENAEGKVVSSLESVLSRSVVLVASFWTPGSSGIGVGSVPAALCSLAKVQEDNVIRVGQREGVGTSDLSKDLRFRSVR
jgi:hypothetical protein